ncbi:MAG: hypothetical protein V4864_16640 [Pseudomonadota bacterium]
MRIKKPSLTKAEVALLLASAALVGVAAAAPWVHSAADAHAFADQRSFFGILYALDVLSNIAFGLAGMAGLFLLWRAPRRAVSNVQRAMSLLFFGGLVLVALGSASYHLDPNDATLAGERYCIAVVLAGLLGLAAAGRVSERAGALLGIGLLAGGLWSVHAWATGGNLLPWLVLQAGAVVVLWWLAALRRNEDALRIDFVLVMVAYGAARLLDLNDAAIFEATGHLVSGHTLKHGVAALAAWPVLTALYAAGQRRCPAILAPISHEVAIRWWRDA